MSHHEQTCCQHFHNRDSEVFGLHSVEAHPAAFQALFDLRKWLVDHEFDILVTKYYRLYMPKVDAFA